MKRPGQTPLFAFAILITASALGVAALVASFSPEPSEASPTDGVSSPNDGDARPPMPSAFALGDCPTPGKTTAGKGRRAEGNPAARGAAQRGLNFLATQAPQWQKQHQCYGCHVHAVTVEAMAVGKHHQYKVNQASLDTLIQAMLTGRGGARGSHGLSYHGGTLLVPSKAFGGAAFARYDQWVDSKLGDDLHQVAAKLRDVQASDGSVPPSWTNLPVGVGAVQTTYQAIQTWNQTYARSADNRWLTAVQKAEGYLQTVVKGWTTTPPQDIQQLNYAIMGLLAAGVGQSEDSLQRLQAWLVQAQRPDGGWSLQHQGGSGAFATGQSLYALRLMGLTDDEPTIHKGMNWLIKHQQPQGGWSSGGFGKAEAMWGVLGLVSLDVLSLTVSGVQDGQRVGDSQHIKARATDNKGGGVVKIELTIDDIPVFAQCGDALSYTWDTRPFETGKHTIQISATNTTGQTSHRRLQVYSGAVYLTQFGSRYDDGGTRISLRNIASRDQRSKVDLSIFSVQDKDGVPTPHKQVRVLQQQGAQGPMSFFWDGKDRSGKGLPPTRYIARFQFKDPSGKALQTEDFPFVHDTEASQRANYGELQGKLNIQDQGGAASNTRVELIDQEGNIVQSTTSNEAGNYRFKNISPKKAEKYKVRVSKKGFKPLERDVAPAPASVKQADVELIAE